MNAKPNARWTLGQLALPARLIDVLLIVLAGYFMSRSYVWLAEGVALTSSIHSFITLFSALCAFTFFPYFQLYESWRGRGVLSMCAQSISAWALVWAAALLVAYLLHKSGEVSRIWAVGWLISGSVLLVCTRVALYCTLRLVRGHGFNKKTVCIVGYGEHGQDLHLKAKRTPGAGYEVVGHYTGPEGTASPDIPLIESIAELPAFLSSQRVDEVWITLPLSAYEKIEKTLTVLRGLAVEIRWMPDAPAVRFITHRSGDVFGFASIDLNHLPNPGVRGIAKGLFDRVSAALILLALSPLMLAIAIAIRCSSRGPVLFKHTRIGANAQRFGVYKFRSMVTNSQEVLTELLRTDPVARAEWEADQKLKNDPRITGIGRILRTTSLDELPQLFNVILGQMSLVGPRPIVDEEVKKYGPAIHYYYSARPGITGLWQVSGRNDVSYDTRVKLDCRYVLNWSLWQDLKILFKTVGVVMRGSGAY